MTDTAQAPTGTEFDQEEANKLIAELLDLRGWDNRPITLNDVARAQKLRDACVERGIQCGLTGDGCTIITVEEAWNEIVAAFLELPGGGDSNGWTALPLSEKEAMDLFEVEKRWG